MTIDYNFEEDRVAHGGELPEETSSIEDFFSAAGREEQRRIVPAASLRAVQDGDIYVKFNVGDEKDANGNPVICSVSMGSKKMFRTPLRTRSFYPETEIRGGAYFLLQLSLGEMGYGFAELGPQHYSRFIHDLAKENSCEVAYDGLVLEAAIAVHSNEETEKKLEGHVLVKPEEVDAYKNKITEQEEEISGFNKKMEAAQKMRNKDVIRWQKKYGELNDKYSSLRGMHRNGFLKRWKYALDIIFGINPEKK